MPYAMFIESLLVSRHGIAGQHTVNWVVAWEALCEDAYKASCI